MKFSYYAQLLAGPLAALLILLFVHPDATNPLPERMLAITAWVAIWWLTEVVHLAVTSMLPFIALPLLQILPAEKVAGLYMDQIMFLFVGGFIIAFGMEKWKLHERISLKILSRTGSSAGSILLGVMLTAYLISMWISNTATVMMLVSAVLAIIYQTDHQSPEGKNKIAAALLIGLAYAATIGGMGTLVGTPPNMAFYSFYKQNFAGDTQLNFASWFMFGFPVSVFLLCVCYLAIRFIFLRKLGNTQFNRQYFVEAHSKLGPMGFEEKAVAIVFALTALLWFTRADIPFSSFTLHGWGALFSKEFQPQDSTVAILMASLLFLLPSKSQPGQRILEWEDVKKMPFDIILLFGCGFALAKGFEVSGLSKLLAAQLGFVSSFSPLFIILFVCVLITIISEFASNIASIQLMLPILLSMVPVLHIHPLLLMIPATLAASLGFMMPIATAPNTIVFGTGRIKVRDMMRTGLLVNIAGIILITLVVWLVGQLLF